MVEYGPVLGSDILESSNHINQYQPNVSQRPEEIKSMSTTSSMLPTSAVENDQSEKPSIHTSNHQHILDNGSFFVDNLQSFEIVIPYTKTFMLTFK